MTAHDAVTLILVIKLSNLTMPIANSKYSRAVKRLQWKAFVKGPQMSVASVNPGSGPLARFAWPLHAPYTRGLLYIKFRSLKTKFRSAAP